MSALGRVWRLLPRDLRRIEPETMLTHLSGIAGLEGVAVAPEAMALIVRAAGSPACPAKQPVEAILLG